jgi:CSLREA domain-containing protein
MSRSRCYPIVRIALLVLVTSVGLAPLGAAARPTQTRPQATFTVNSDNDTPDASPGDGLCADSLGDCTLRAAIEEANAGSGGDTIDFAGQMYIYVLTPLPAILLPGTTMDASSVWDMGNDAPGVHLNGGDKTFSGLTLAGSYDIVRGLHLFNFSSAIYVNSAHNMIGGTDSGQRNVVSGNAWGIWIDGTAAQYNDVQGNWIGLSVLGNTADPNTPYGVVIGDGATHNTIGGDTAAQGNYISGNADVGVFILNAGTDGNRLGGNTIGLGADNSTRVGNGGHGVSVYQGPQNTWIGGGSLAGNTIVANGWCGIDLWRTRWNTVQSNTIRENNGDGVALADSSNSQVVANTIAANAENGVYIAGITATHNLVTANGIYDNVGLGIKLQYGGNANLPAPAITSATPSRVEGTACASCVVDVYSDSAEEGEIYHGSTNADASGNWVYTGTISGPNATATNRDAQNNTSEFSAPVPVAPPCTPLTGMDIDGPGIVPVGIEVCFATTVTPANASAPIDYAWSPQPGGPCYTWSSPGTYWITVTASNCSGAGNAFDTQLITVADVCTAVTGVAISGPTTGLVGVPYTLHADVTPPDAGTPLTYTWSPAPDSGQGTANASYTWDTAGWYSVMVEVSNCGSPGVLYDTHNITITAETVYRVYLPAVEKHK